MSTLINWILAFFGWGPCYICQHFGLRKLGRVRPKYNDGYVCSRCWDNCLIWDEQFPDDAICPLCDKPEELCDCNQAEGLVCHICGGYHHESNCPELDIVGNYDDPFADEGAPEPDGTSWVCLRCFASHDVDETACDCTSCPVCQQYTSQEGWEKLGCGPCYQNDEDIRNEASNPYL